MKPVFQYLQYREFIRELCEDLKKEALQSFRFADLAKFIGIQATYLSRVFSGDAHLNPDQLDRACEYFLLKEDEVEFLLLLQDWERSSYPSRKKRLMAKIEKLRKAPCETSAHLKAKKLKTDCRENMARYFLEPYAPIVHTFFSIERFAKNPRLIGAEIGLSERKLKAIVNLLQALGLIQFDDILRRYRMAEDHIHLEKDSDVNESYQRLSRMVSSEFCSRLNSDEKHQYCVSFGATPEAYQAVHQEFNAFIARVEKLVRASATEKIYQLDFQLFPWQQSIGAVAPKSEIQNMEGATL